MKHLILVIGLTFGLNAFGATNNVVFTKSVAPMSADRAVLDAAAGEVVYKCQPVEMKISKSGTSVSLRAKKKKLTKEEAADKINEIEKQAE
jgi:hypothetical protein